MRNIIINNLLKYIKNNTNDITNEKLEIRIWFSIYIPINK